jgi:hypothetical protein
VRAGEVLHIPSNVPHMAVTLEHTLNRLRPPRQDWLDCKKPGGDEGEGARGSGVGVRPPA